MMSYWIGRTIQFIKDDDDDDYGEDDTATSSEAGKVWAAKLCCC